MLDCMKENRKMRHFRFRERKKMQTELFPPAGYAEKKFHPAGFSQTNLFFFGLSENIIYFKIRSGKIVSFSSTKVSEKHFQAGV